MATQPKVIAPLGFFGALFWSLLVGLASAKRREVLRGRRAARLVAAGERRKENGIKRQLRREAIDYANIIINRYSYLGEFHRPKTETDGPKRRIKKQRIYRVRFDAVRMEVERIYFRIATTERGIFGWQSALPYQVRVGDLISPETLLELSIACKRQVVVDASDFRRGCWLIVNRLEGVDGLPKQVNFSEFLHFYPDGSISQLPMVLGVAEHRKIVRLNLGDYPHMMIGGSSGGGKSNMLNCIIAGLMRFVPVDDLRFILIDFKRLEFSLYENAPHLLKPIIYETGAALAELQDLQIELDRRTKVMQGKAKDLPTFNTKFPADKMPRIVLVIDEYAVIRLDPNKKISDSVEYILWDIGNRGRAQGIHMIICTQRPAREVLSNRIKVNMSLTIAARTQNNAQSMTIVDDGSAARLPDNPRGRMIYLAGALHDVVQAPYIPDEDVTDSIRIARGKLAGVIRLDRGLPVVIDEGLTGYVESTLAGKLSGQRDHMLDMGITQKMYRDYRARLALTRAIVRRGNDNYLVPLVDPPGAANPIGAAVLPQTIMCMGCRLPDAALCDTCLTGVFPVAPYRLPDSAIAEYRVSARSDSVVGRAVAAVDQPGVIDALGKRLSWMISESRWSFDCIVASPGGGDLARAACALSGWVFAGEMRHIQDVIAIDDIQAIRNKRVIVVGPGANDFTECAAALCAAGAREVYGLAVAGEGIGLDVVERARAILRGKG